MNTTTLSKMHYIYSLSFGRHIFYIGLTTNPKQRFECHLCDSPASRFIKFIMEFTDLKPRFDILDCDERADISVKLEQEYIRHFSESKRGIGLINQIPVQDIFIRFIPLIKRERVKNSLQFRSQHIDLQITKANKKYGKLRPIYMGNTASISDRVNKNIRGTNYRTACSQLDKAWKAAIEKNRRTKSSPSKPKLPKNRIEA